MDTICGIKRKLYFTAGRAWDGLTQHQKLELCERLGWRTLKGTPDRTARKLSKQLWCELTHAACNVISRYIRK